MKKSELLEILTENRSKHQTDFQKACVIYKQEVLKGFKKLTKDAKKASDPSHIITGLHIITPISQVDDYDRTISMLNHTLDIEIELDQHEYRQYVLDEWQWKGAFNATTMAYANAAPAKARKPYTKKTK